MSFVKRTVVSTGLLLLLFLLWEGACRLANIPIFILPAPSRVLFVAVTQAPLLAYHAAMTGIEIILGIFFSITAAIPLAVVMFVYPSVEQAFPLFLWHHRPFQFLSLAPLLIVWFGYGIWSKVFMAAIIIFFPIVVNLLEGLKSCDSDYRKLFHLMGAPFFQSFRYLYWPWALPYFLAGLKVGVSVATIGAVIGEWVGAQRGLGYLMIQSNARLRVDLVFASILWLTAIGIFLWILVGAIEKRTLTWTR